MEKLEYLEMLATDILEEYDILRDLYLDNKDKTNEYKSHVKVLKSLYNKEQNILHSLSIQTIDEDIAMLMMLEGTKLDVDVVFTRVYDHLLFNYDYMVCSTDVDSSINEVPLSSLEEEYLYAYVYLKALQRFDKVVLNDTLYLKDISVKTYEEMRRSYKEMKFGLIKSNRFLEYLCINSDFDLNSISEIEIPSQRETEYIFKLCLDGLNAISKRYKIDNSIDGMVDDYFDLIVFEECIKLLDCEQLEYLKNYCEVLSYKSKSELLDSYILKLEQY